MKRLNFIFLVIIAVIPLNGQSNLSYHFSELRGIENTAGQTCLFYRLRSDIASVTDTQPVNGTNSIYLFKPDTRTDTLFAEDYAYWNVEQNIDLVHEVSNFAFLGNDLNKAVLCVMTCGAECGWTITAPGGTVHYSWDTPIYHLQASTQSDSVLYALGTQLYKTTNMGKKWNATLTAFSPISIKPCDEKIIYGYTQNELVRSSDSGLTSTSFMTIAGGEQSCFFYDPDQKHVYMTIPTKKAPAMYTSAEDGINGSWQELSPPLPPDYCQTDPSRTGVLWLCSQNVIYISRDFGQSFTFFNTTDKKITGFYAKPGSDTVYATTRLSLFRLTSNSRLVLKSLPLPTDAHDWYPLHKGDKWVYTRNSFDNSPLDPGTNTTIVKEVTLDTLINGKIYSTIKQTTTGEDGKSLTVAYYERYDTTSGSIYHTVSGPEYKIFDTALEQGDTTTACIPRDLFLYQHTIATLFGITAAKNIYIETRIIPGIYYTYMKGIGMTAASVMEMGSGFFQNLIGYFHEGIAHGDTSALLGVKGMNRQTPATYYLEQNYPNPFNPSTKIQYGLASTEFVSVYVYNLLGEKIATLVHEVESAGPHTTFLNGASLPSGPYIVHIVTKNFQASRKILLLK